MSPQDPRAPEHFPSSSSSPSSLHPSLEMAGIGERQLPDVAKSPRELSSEAASPAPESWEEVLVRIPGAIVHLIDKEQSVELACGELVIVRLWQGGQVVAILARVGDAIQWPLAYDEAAVKLDESHYFFTLRVPSGNTERYGTDDDNNEIPIEREGEDFLNYGLTIASRGQEELLQELDGVLECYSNFSTQTVNLDGSVARETSPAEMGSEKEKRERMEESSAAYWTTLAPNVEDYSSSVARMIAAGSVQLIKGILWCGDVTVDRLKWGNEFLKERMGPGSKSEISPETFGRIERFVTLALP